MESTKIFDPVRPKFDMSKIRATYFKMNQWVIMPAPRPTKEECRLEVRTEIMKKVFKDYMEEFCDDKGEQVQKNLDRDKK